MEKRLKLKPYVIPAIYTLSLIVLLVGIFFTTKALDSDKQIKETFVNNSIISADESVVKVANTIIRPYTSSEVKVGRNYYDYKAESKEQENSITYYKNTYMQSAGVSYVSENPFEVVSILEGTVTQVKKDDTLGYIVVIKHNDNLTSTYESLSEVKVKENDTVIQGQIIANSGTNEMEKDLGNHLYFELSNKNNLVNPEDYYDKDINSLE